MTVIEVYADIWCPFAHVGLRSVRDRTRQLERNDVITVVRPWPLELVNGAPLDPSTTAQHVKDLREQVAPELFRHFHPEHFPTTTLPALALVAASYHKNTRLGETVSFVLRDALFEEGRDISRPDVLASIASTYGVRLADADDSAVLAEWHEGEARGVKGSPHFFCGDAEVFCPSLQFGRNAEGRLEIQRNRDAVEAFLTQCLEEQTMSSQLHH